MTDDLKGEDLGLVQAMKLLTGAGVITISGDSLKDDRALLKSAQEVIRSGAMNKDSVFEIADDLARGRVIFADTSKLDQTSQQHQFMSSLQCLHDFGEPVSAIEKLRTARGLNPEDIDEFRRNNSVQVAAIVERARLIETERCVHAVKANDEFGIKASVFKGVRDYTCQRKGYPYQAYWPLYRLQRAPRKAIGKRRRNPVWAVRGRPLLYKVGHHERY